MPNNNLFDRALAAFDRLAKKVSPWVPFTAPYQVQKAAKASSGWSILDLGCGPGGRVGLFDTRRVECYAVGVDIWLPYLQIQKSLKAYDEFVLGDVRHLPFQKKSFDMVIGLELLEHLDKSDGTKLLAAMEGIARKKVVLSLPAGTHIQDAYDNNPYQEHRSTWTPSELQHLGYKVQVNGIRNSGGKSGMGTRIPPLLSPFWRVLNVLAGPVVSLFPQGGGHMVCSKSFRE